MSRRILVFFALLLGAAAPAAAQRVITLHPVNILGKVVQVGPRAIIVQGDDGQTWTLSLDNSTSVRIKGTAVPEVISPKLCVRFIASIDKRTGKAQDKIDKITLFTPVDGIVSRTLGVEKAANASPDDAEAEALAPPTPPMAPPSGGPGMGQSPPRGMRGDRPPRGAGKVPAESVPDVDSYEVCAQVLSYHGNRLVAKVQNRFVKSRILAELSPDAEIAVDLSNLSLAKAGDKVAAAGWYVMPGICAKTTKLVVTLAEPLVPPGKHLHRPRPAAKGSDAPHHASGKAKPAPAESPEPPDGDEPAPATHPTHPAVAGEHPKDDDPESGQPNPKPDAAEK